MNILVINGSPRGGNSNTMILTRAFLDGYGAVQEVAATSLLSYFPVSPCIFSRFVETVRKCRNKEGVRTSFSNFSDTAEAGGNGAEIIDVSQADVKGCPGCFACWNTMPGKCVIDDSMAEILSRLIAADVIVWSFPLYYFGVSGALKKLIDRQLPLNLPFMAGGATRIIAAWFQKWCPARWARG